MSNRSVQVRNQVHPLELLQRCEGPVGLRKRIAQACEFVEIVDASTTLDDLAIRMELSRDGLARALGIPESTVHRVLALGSKAQGCCPFSTHIRQERLEEGKSRISKRTVKRIYKEARKKGLFKESWDQIRLTGESLAKWESLSTVLPRWDKHFEDVESSVDASDVPQSPPEIQSARLLEIIDMLTLNGVDWPSDSQRCTQEELVQHARNQFGMDERDDADEESVVGVLDYWHLRWFTLSHWNHMSAACGLIEAVEGENVGQIGHSLQLCKQLHGLRGTGQQFVREFAEEPESEEFFESNLRIPVKTFRDADYDLDMACLMEPKVVEAVDAVLSYARQIQKGESP